MKQASISILSAENKALLESMLIDYYPLHNSKADEIAFSTNGRRTREFEIKFMSDGSYRFGTRFLGYKRVMEKYTGAIEKIKDPDGRRYGFRSVVYDKAGLNALLEKLLTEGFNSDPKIELIQK